MNVKINKSLVIWLTIVSLVGCTSMQAMNTEKPDFTENLKKGDRLTIYEKTGRIVAMELIRFENSRFFGAHIPTRDLVEIDLKDIERIDVEKIDGGKTTLAVIGGVVLVVAVAAMALIAGMANYR